MKCSAESGRAALVVPWSGPHSRMSSVVFDGARSRCTEDSCDARPPVCESCGVGVMVTRRARRGWFLGLLGVRLGPALHPHPEPAGPPVARLRAGRGGPCRNVTCSTSGTSRVLV